MDTNEAKVLHTILTCALLFGSIITIFVLTLVKHHRRTIAIQRENTSIEINTLETERDRIGRDMHDDISPLLAAVMLHLDSLGSLTSRQSNSVNKMKLLLHDASVKIRETSNDLLPSLIINKGLLYAINDFIEKAEDENRLAIHCNLPPFVSLPPDKDHVHVYRIFKEIFHNCIKHSKAQNFYVVVKLSKQRLMLSCRDDGIGYSVQTAFKQGRGKGLTNIMNRVEYLNGVMYVTAKPGKGASYTIDLPYKS